MTEVDSEFEKRIRAQFNAQRLDEVRLPQPLHLNTRLWRYIDIKKLEQLLKDRALYLRRVTNFQDPLEGKLSLASEREWVTHILQNKIPSEEHRRQWQRFEIDRWISYASCWRMDEEQCSQAWNVYGSQLAIKTTLPKLKTALNYGVDLPSRDDVKIGTVTYIDRLKDPIPKDSGFFPLLIKDNAYAWESEIRVIQTLSSLRDKVGTEIFDHGLSEPTTNIAIGARIKVENFIEEIVIAPGSASNILGDIRTILNQYGIQIPIVRSEDLPHKSSIIRV